MWYVSSMPNSSGAYSGPKSNSFSGALALTDDQVQTLIQYNGFVTITQEPDPEIEGSTVTVTPNTEAWEAWKEAEASKPKPEQEPTVDEILNALLGLEEEQGMNDEFTVNGNLGGGNSI